MKIRKAAAAFAVAGSALTLAATAAPALAAPTAPALTASWHNTGQTFYWYSSCKAAGEAGVHSGWQSYDCKGSSAPWADYELWGLY